MSDKLTRRQFVTKTAAVTAGIAVAPLLQAQQTPAEGAQITDSDLAVVEKQLAKPLTTEAKTILKTSLKNVRDNASNRQKTKLPENSEPCTTYIATGHRRAK